MVNGGVPAKCPQQIWHFFPAQISTVVLDNQMIKGVIPNSVNYNLIKLPHTQTQVKTNCVLWVFKTYLIKTSREIPCVIYNTKYYTKTSQDPIIMNNRVILIQM